MDVTALILSRIQFAFTVSFHIIFPAFTIGLAAWLTVLEAMHLATGRPAYRVVFEFWLKIFGVAFGLGVVRNLFAITLPPPFGSLINSDNLGAGEVGLDSIPPENRPPVVIPFFAFRIMVGCGLAMLALAWLGTYLDFKGRIGQSRLLLWLIFISFPLPFIATWTGWFTAEVGRQPWVVYGVLRTVDAMTPFLTTRAAAISLVVFCTVYVFIFSFGTLYIYRLLRVGPVGDLVRAPTAAVPNRPMSVVDESPTPSLVAGE